MANPEQIRADNSALEHLSRTFNKPLTRYFYRRGLSTIECEDAVQEVFARLAKRTGLAEIERLEGYMFQTATHVAIDFHRSRITRRSIVHDLGVDMFDGNSGLSPEDIYLGREDMNLLLVAIQELPERTRHILILSRLEQMKNAEVAQYLGISVSAVEKNLVKALGHLGFRLGRR